MKLDNESIDKKSFSFRDLVGQKSEWTPRQNPRNVTASTNSNFLDDVVRVDCTAGAVTITLETAVACDGRQHTFKKIDASANAMIVDGAGSETIDGAATLSTAVRYMTYVIKSNGTNWDLISAAVTSAPGTVTSVAETFTGGIISVAGSPITTSGTLALTVAGTSGGVPYFSSGTAWASSAALAASAIVLGGGAGTAPATLGSLGTTTTVLHGNAAGAPTFGAVSLTADVSGTLPVANGGTGFSVKPAFLVTSNGAANVTGDNTNYTVVWNNEIYDQGGDFASNTFTAPVTGKYLLSFNVGLTEGSINQTLWQVAIITSNRNYLQEVATTGNITVQNSFNITVVADMDAADTATTTVRVFGTTFPVDVMGATYTFFSGQLLC